MLTINIGEVLEKISSMANISNLFSLILLYAIVSFCNADTSKIFLMHQFNQFHENED